MRMWDILARMFIGFELLEKEAFAHHRVSVHELIEIRKKVVELKRKLIFGIIIYLFLALNCMGCRQTNSDQMDEAPEYMTSVSTVQDASLEGMYAEAEKITEIIVKYVMSESWFEEGYQIKAVDIEHLFSGLAIAQAHSEEEYPYMEKSIVTDDGMYRVWEEDSVIDIIYSFWGADWIEPSDLLEYDIEKKSYRMLMPVCHYNSPFWPEEITTESDNRDSIELCVHITESKVFEYEPHDYGRWIFSYTIYQGKLKFCGLKKA